MGWKGKIPLHDEVGWCHDAAIVAVDHVFNDFELPLTDREAFGILAEGETAKSSARKAISVAVIVPEDLDLGAEDGGGNVIAALVGRLQESSEDLGTQSPDEADDRRQQ